MKLLYSEEHLRCINYDLDKNPVIEEILIDKNELWKNLPLENKLIFILKGEISFSFGKFIDCQIGDKKVIHLPAGYNFACKSLSNSKLLSISIRGQSRFCDDYLFKDLERDTSNSLEYIALEEINPATLDINEVLEKYLDTLQQYLNAGVRCKSFYQIKIKELFYIFRWFYTKEALMRFFQSSLKGGDEFAACIIETGHKYRSVSELAESMNYTVSGFEKRFKRIFGISPYKWMIHQKAGKIFHQVRTTDLTFKQISSNFGFTSLSRFNDFCKTNLGKPPGDIRENNRIGGNHE